MSLDDIWEEPIVETSVSITEGRDTETLASSSSRPALFLSDSEDEGAAGPGRHVSSRPASPPGPENVLQAPEKSQLDAMFAGLDDDDDDPFKDIAPAVNVEELKRQADARLAATSSHNFALASTTFSSQGDRSSPPRDKDKKKGGAKTKRVMPKLDEERLLGHDGFPRLLKAYKSFKVTGKGHEAADLEKLFRIYHAWAHKMYPKFQFRDTVDAVEKRCRSRRMTVNLKVWRDEAHGITPDVQHEVTLDGEGSDHEQGSGDEEANSDQDVQEAPSPSSPRPSTPVTRPGSVASTAPSVPSSATDDDMDMDIDALLREEEELMRETKGMKEGASSYKPSNAEDDEEELWAAAGGALDDVPELNTVSRPETTGPVPQTFGEADNEDMWDMIDELDAQVSTTKDSTEVKKVQSIATSEPVTPPASLDQPSIGADWDDMYA